MGLSKAVNYVNPSHNPSHNPNPNPNPDPDPSPKDRESSLGRRFLLTLPRARQSPRGAGPGTGGANLEIEMLELGLAILEWISGIEPR